MWRQYSHRLGIIHGPLELQQSLLYAKYQDWKHSGSMGLLTTPDGADLSAGAKVEQFPVLERLRRDFLDFVQAKPNGDDLRFSSTLPRAGDQRECLTHIRMTHLWRQLGRMS